VLAFSRGDPCQDQAASGLRIGEVDVAFLTESQQAYLREQAQAFLRAPDWTAEIERRHDASRRFRAEVEASGVLDGRVLERRTLARLVEIVREIQNLNPIVLPQLLGTHTYYQHFRGFEGDAEAFAAYMAKRRRDWTPGSAGYPGADIAAVSSDLARCLSPGSDADFGPALHRLIGHPGLGRALASGLILLWNPMEMAMVNNAATGPFKGRTGLLTLGKTRLGQLREEARERFGLPRASEYTQTARTLGWTLLFEEARDVCEFRDFFELDQLLWRLTTAAKGKPKGHTRPTGGGSTVDPEDIIARALAAYPPERATARQRAIAGARSLIESKLGSMDEDDIRELLRLFNADFGRGQARADRFSPAFVGVLAGELVDRTPEVNRWIEALWSAGSDEEVEGVLDEFWGRSDLPGAGRSFPTMVLHVREPDRFFPLMAGLAKGLQVLTAFNPRGKTGHAFLTYSHKLQELRESHQVPVCATDLVLWEAMKAERPPEARSFAGFTTQAFSFMANLGRHNSGEWLASNRAEFKQAVREPMRDLIADLGRLFIDKVAPELEHAPKSPNTLGNIGKMRFKGAGNAPWPNYWAAFHRPEFKKTRDFQLYVLISADSLSWGMSTESASPDDKRRFAERLRQHPDLAQRALAEAVAAGLDPGDSVSIPRQSRGL
jgi:uncharacterized protein (DUF2461 family)